MKGWLVTLVALGLGGCASAPRSSGVELLLHDDRFPPPAAPIRRDVFALSEPMRRYLADRIAVNVPRKGPARALFDALEQELKLEYDSQMTRTAAQAFEARTGNCLSLVILTAALAKHMSIALEYRSVFGHDSWSRSDGMTFRAGHVNIVLGPLVPTAYVVAGREPAMTVDFLPSSSAGMQASRPIPEETVLAMYFSNRAAEVLVNGDVEGAYWWAREAVATSPSFLGAVNTLGIIYLRHGDLAEAEAALRHVLAREPENPQSLTNLAIVLDAAGRPEEARKVRAYLAAIQPYPPFYFYDKGMDALEHDDVRMAMAWFKRELERTPYDDEVHFGLALANLRMGQSKSARRHLLLAMENSTTADRQHLYAAKLEHIKAVQRQ